MTGGVRMPVAAFENGAAALSCGLLLDTSQSMDAALPALKGAARKLIAGLRPDDAVAVYSLTGGISELQPFTTDKVAAVRAVMRAELGEMTALYDGLVRVNRDLAGRTGKKVIVVLTDGEDTASTLSAETAILRADRGVPIYTIAQGHAVAHSTLLKELGGISQATGGLAFTIPVGLRNRAGIRERPPGLAARIPPGLFAGRRRGSRVAQHRGPAPPGKVRAREGYFAE